MLTSTMAVFPGLLPPEHQKIIKLRKGRPGYEATFELPCIMQKLNVTYFI